MSTVRLALLLFLLTTVFSLKVFLVGGAVDDDEADIYQAIAHSTGKTPRPGNCDPDWSTTPCPKIAVVTSASPTSQDGYDEYYVQEDPDLMSFEAIFNFYGLSPKHVTAHIDNYVVHTNISTPEGRNNLDILNQADIVYFNGGDQSRHARTWLRDDGTCGTIFCLVIARARRDEIALGGTSSGTMIMSNPTYGEGSAFGHLLYANQWGLAKKKVTDGAVDGTGLMDVRNGTDCLLSDYNGGEMPGFGFVPNQYLTDTHFDRRSRLLRLIPGIRSTNKKYGIGVDQGATFYIDGTMGEALGENGVFIVDMTRAAFPSKADYFEVSGVRVHYLTKGDRYNFNTHQVFSSKSLITVPAYNETTTSDQINSRYECTRLITYLVDQMFSSVYGTTSANEDFPQDTHVFKITFTKDASTRGYKGVGEKSQILYTAVNVLVNIGPA